jgi:hypothetical protein
MAAAPSRRLVVARGTRETEHLFDLPPFWIEHPFDVKTPSAAPLSRLEGTIAAACASLNGTGVRKPGPAG